MPTRTPRNHSGYTITELLTVIAIIGMFSAIALPSWITLQRHAAVRAAAEELQSVFRGARMRAIASGRNVGVRFTKSGTTWMYALYDDRNGNGIKTAEITSGVDKMIARPKRLLDTVRYASIATPTKTIIDPDGDKLNPTDSPVQFGTSAICSFSPLGAATPGTIYLTDGSGEIWSSAMTWPTGRRTCALRARPGLCEFYTGGVDYSVLRAGLGRLKDDVFRANSHRVSRWRCRRRCRARAWAEMRRVRKPD